MRPLRVSVRNVRSAMDVELNLRPFSAVIGPNNAGKSTLLDAVRLFYGTLGWDRRRDRPWTAAEDEPSWVEIEYALTAEENGRLFGASEGESAADLRLTVRRYLTDHEGFREGDYYYVPGDGSGPEHTGWEDVAGRLGRCVYIPPLAQVSEQTSLTGPSPLREILLLAFSEQHIQVYLDAVQSTLSGLRQYLGKGPVLALENELDRTLSPWGLNARVRVNDLTDEFILRNLIDLTFEEEGTERSVTAQGSGVQRTVIAGLLQTAARLRAKEDDADFRWILFEEPESFLHPAQVTRLAQDLRQLTAAGNAAVTVTTHDPTLLAAAETRPESIARIQRFGAGIRATSPAPAVVTRTLDAIHLRSSYAQASNSCFKTVRQTPAGEERTRVLYDLDGRRAAAFFADRVIVVEGVSDVVFFEWLDRRGHLRKAGPNVGVIDAGGKFELHRAVATLALYGIPHVVVWDEDAAMQPPGTVKCTEAACRDRAALDALRDAAETNPAFAGGVRLSGSIERWLGITEERTGAWKSANMGAAMADAYADPASDIPAKVGGLVEVIAGLFDNVDLAPFRSRPEFAGALINRKLGAATVSIATEVAALPRSGCRCRFGP